MRLLQKEREEREIDGEFTKWKETIIQQAKSLDEEKKQFLLKQQDVLENIAADKQQIINNQAKRKQEDEKLRKLNQDALAHQQTIEQLQKNIEK